MITDKQVVWWICGFFLCAVYTQQLQLNHQDGELVVCRMIDWCQYLNWEKMNKSGIPYDHGAYVIRIGVLLRVWRSLWKSVQPMDRLARVVVTGRKPTFMNTRSDSFTIVYLYLHKEMISSHPHIRYCWLYSFVYTDDADCLLEHSGCDCKAIWTMHSILSSCHMQPPLLQYTLCAV